MWVILGIESDFNCPFNTFSRLLDLVGFGVALASGMQYLENSPGSVDKSMLIPLMFEDKRTGKIIQILPTVFLFFPWGFLCWSLKIASIPEIPFTVHLPFTQAKPLKRDFTSMRVIGRPSLILISSSMLRSQGEWLELCLILRFVFTFQSSNTPFFSVHKYSCLPCSELNGNKNI